MSKNLEHTRYALLGYKLYSRCQQGVDGKVTDSDLMDRLVYLRAMYKDLNDGQRSRYKDYNEADQRLVREVIDETGILDRLAKPLGPNDVQRLRDMCELRSSSSIDVELQGINELLNGWWGQKVTRKRDEASGLTYIEIPQGAALFHGTHHSMNKGPTEMTPPVYFANLYAASQYGFPLGRSTNRLPGEGKINMYLVIQPLRIIDMNSTDNWSLLMPSRRSVPNDVRKHIQYAYGYPVQPNIGHVYRQSHTNTDIELHRYLCEQAQHLEFDGVGNTNIPGHHNEVVLCNQAALSKLEQLPYKIVMNEELFDGGDRSGTKCLYLVRDRDGAEEYVAAISNVEFNFMISPVEDAMMTAKPLSSQDKQAIRKMCALRTLGNKVSH
jgi:hypothetical protein